MFFSRNRASRTGQKTVQVQGLADMKIWEIVEIQTEGIERSQLQLTHDAGREEFEMQVLVPEPPPAVEMDFPPKCCPKCGSEFRPGDFELGNIQCRHCGQTVILRHVLREEERLEFCESFLKQSLHKKRAFAASLFAVGACLLFFICQHCLKVGVKAHFYSQTALWPFLDTLFAFLVFGAYEYWVNTIRPLRWLLASGKLDFFDVEAVIMKNSIENVGEKTVETVELVENEVKERAKWRDRLLALFRDKGHLRGAGDPSTLEVKPWRIIDNVREFTLAHTLRHAQVSYAPLYRFVLFLLILKSA